MATRLSILALLAWAFGGTAVAQPAPKKKIMVGIYAPSIEFGAATARIAYVQALAKAIQQNTGLEVEAQSYANLAALKKDNVDFAIVDGQCFSANLGWRILATATIGGATTRPWALYSSAGDTMQSLKGKKLAFIAMGCNDAGFVDNAMLESEVDASFFGARIGKPDLAAAVAEVAAVKTAQAVFAPAGSVKGLAKVFDTGAVPNPAFVDLGTKQPQVVIDKVAAAVVGYGGSGAIGGWTKPSREIYASLSGRMAKVVKAPIPANPEPVRIDANVLIDPASLKDTALVSVRQHFVRPPGERLE
jgi:hypothetical protein